MHQPSNPDSAEAPSADDMLAELAGEEVDRLLAEAEAEVEAEAEQEGEVALTPAPPTAAPPAAANVQAAQAQGAQTQGAQGHAAPYSPPYVPATGTPIDVEPAPASPTDAPPTNSAPISNVETTAAGAADAPHSPASAPEKDQTTGESAALSRSAADFPDAEAPAGAAMSLTASASTGPESDAAKLPVTIRLSDAILAPLEEMPDGLRDAIGKVAVITMINAVAVLLYVTAFRHSHGKTATVPAATAPHVLERSDRSSARSASGDRSQKPGS